MQRAILLGCVTQILVAPLAIADFVMYAWSGHVEPIGSNPWGLLGDGSALTASDGTPFQVRALARPTPPTSTAENPNYASFRPILLRSISPLGGNSSPLRPPVAVRWLSRPGVDTDPLFLPDVRPPERHPRQGLGGAIARSVSTR